MGKFIRQLRAQQAAQAAAKAEAQAAADAAEKKRQEDLKRASAITDNGSTVETVASNTTNQAASSEKVSDTEIYINNLKNRKRRGAPIAQASNSLGQVGILGV